MTPTDPALRALDVDEAIEKALLYVFQLSNKDYRTFQTALSESAFVRALEQDGYSVVPLAAAEAAPPTETAFAWLIERGQPEGQVPTVWWDNRVGVGSVGVWTNDANQATKYPTREAAERVIADTFTPPASRGEPSARAVQHGFLTAAEAAPLDVERLARALENLYREKWDAPATAAVTLFGAYAHDIAREYAQTDALAATSREDWPKDGYNYDEPSPGYIDTGGNQGGYGSE